MWFVDRAEITVAAGAGGNGCSAMFQAPYDRHPRPSGGSGGDGGSVILRADGQLSTLLDFHFKHEFRAQRGGHGGGNNKTGKRGVDAVIRVPIGTIVYEQETELLLRDLAREQDELLVVRGGRGGAGNFNAARATPGQPGERRPLRLELKLLADVGLVGFPNAGKSSLLARISTARPKVAPYPFTTRTPVLGVVRLDPERIFVACDIPGLIEGAHEGKGLGMQFLRHIERTRLLVHLIDMAGVDGRDPAVSYRQLNQELVSYSQVLAARPQILVANKLDLPDAREQLARFRAATGEPILEISCATGEGIPNLLEAIWARLQQLEPIILDADMGSSHHA